MLFCSVLFCSVLFCSLNVVDDAECPPAPFFQDVCTGFEWFNHSRIESGGLDVERGGGDDFTAEQALDSNDSFNILTCGKDGWVVK